MHKQGELQDAVLTHVNNFTIAGNENFLEKGKNKILGTLAISKVEKDKFRFTGWDIEKYEDQVKVSMEDYSNSLKEMTDIRKANRNDKLTKLEMKEYRKVTGKLSWLAEGT